MLRTFGQDTPLETITAQDVLGNVRVADPAGRCVSPDSTFNGGLSETSQFIDQRVDTSDLQAAALAGILALDAPLPSTVDGDIEFAFTRNLFGSTLTTLRGPLAQLPGGEMLATFDLGYNWNRQQSQDTRQDQAFELTRGDLSTGVNLVIPITSRRNGFADALGSFTLNGQIGLQHLSDFGTLG